MATATAHPSNQSSPVADTITVTEFQQMLTSVPAVRVIDVRTGGEFETSHIAGSYNVPLDTLSEHVDDLAEVDHPVVLVCQSGGRASKAHSALRAGGKTNLHILEGGMNAWQATGGDSVRGDADRWTMDRQVRFTAGSMVLGAVVASIGLPFAKWIAAGVASGLIYSAISNSCAMASVLAKLPYNQTDRCDIASVLEDLNRKAA